MSPESNGEFITLARVVKTQGRHGEVAAEIHSDVPDRFTEGMKLLALAKKTQAKDQARRELQIEDLWPHKGLLVLKFQGVDSMTDAEVLIGSELQVPQTERAKLDQGWSFISDLIGCTLLDRNREVGRIEDVQFGAGEAPLLIVAKAGEGSKGGEVTKYDVPFAEAYLEGVDVAHRQVRMNLPEGLLEVNAPMTAEEKQVQQKEKRRRR